MESITRLREFSFLSVREGEEEVLQQYEIHKLVQEATRYGLSVRSTGDAAYFSNVALQIVERLFPESRPETWRECEKYVTHAVELGKWAEVCERGIEVSDLLGRVSDYFHDCGRWIDKQPVDERMYEVRQQVLGEEHPHTIESLGNLAATYRAQGRYSEAEPMEVKALALWQQVLGEEHPDKIQSLANLAATYHAQGRYSEAEPMQVKALALRQQVLGEKHPHTIESLANLATNYHAQGRCEEAKTMQAQASELQEQVKATELQKQALHGKDPDAI